MTPLRVMIVYPETSVARRLAEVVVRAGHAPILVPDGERAIDRFVQEPVEVVVVEYFLPGRDGVTTVESIRWAPRGREVKVLLLADAEPEVAPLAALGARIDAIETLVGDPDDVRFAAALEATTRSGSAPRPVTVPSFDDDTATGQPPETFLSKSAATRFDDESTVQGSAEMARAIVRSAAAPGHAPVPPPAGDPKTAPALDASLALAKKMRRGSDDVGTRVAKQKSDAGGAPEWRRDPGTVAEAKEVREQAARAEGSEVSSTGRFEETPFPALLARLADAKTSGALVCKAESSARETTNGDAPTKVVYFRSGVPTFVRSNLLDECLGQLLLRQKRIGKATLEESVRRMLRGDGRQGEILVELGALSPMVLSESLATQAREKLYDLFGWQRGSYRLSSRVDAPRDGTQLELGLPEIVYEGVCAAMPATRLLDVLTPSLELYVVPSPERLARFTRVRVPSELKPLLMGLDGTARLRQLLESGARAGAVAQLVYALSCLGAVRFEKTPSRRLVAPAPDALGSSQEFAPRITRALETAPRPPDAPLPAWDDETSREGRRQKAGAPAAGRSEPPPLEPARRDEATGGERPTKRPPRPSVSPEAAVAEPAAATAAASGAHSAVALGPSGAQSPVAIGPSGAQSPVAIGPPPAQPRSEAVAEAAALSIAEPATPPRPGAPAAPHAAPPPHAPTASPAPAPVTPAPDLDARVDRLFEAERHFRRGSRALERGKLDDALSAFVRASELCPTEGEFLAYVGWARAAIAPEDEAIGEIALRELAQATELSPGLYVTHLLHGRLLERARRTGEARRAYQRVLGIEPQNEEAQSAARRLA